MLRVFYQSTPLPSELREGNLYAKNGVKVQESTMPAPGGELWELFCKTFEGSYGTSLNLWSVQGASYMIALEGLVPKFIIEKDE